ncbi:MAG: helix-turn-helix transcriptional regulator [Planctomycetes bacterium]|nr:helix-turn-helix transcriptional regulator [Planctomycetota bacterium]MCL4729709.1 helix-turn-helix domain-containing protein [Planctomycetota bacterium]
MARARSEFHTRLHFLAQRFSQAEIARKTGTSRNNVSRYMRGAKLPVEFAAALVRGLGVNPAWLVAGEGTPYLSDVNTTTQKTAGDLLELVAAMNSVASMQLGSLTGKHHLRVLRELNDALARYQQLRVSINEKTAPIFTRILDDYWKALDRWELDRAQDIQRAAEQVAKLCDDPALNLRFERTLAYHAYLRRDVDDSIAHQKRVFQRSLTQGALIDEAGMKEAYNLANTMQSVGRMAEARALCDGVLALARVNGSRLPIYRYLSALGGYCQLELGDLRDGMARIMAALPQSDPRMALNQNSMMIRALLLSGALDFRQAAEAGDFGPAHAQGMVSWAIMLEDAPALQLAVKRFTQPAADDFTTRLARAWAALLKGDTAPARQVIRDFGRPREHGPHNERFDRAMYAAQLTRKYAPKEARAYFAAARGAIEEAPPGVDMSIIGLANFHRTALELCRDGRGEDARSLADAQAFFARVHNAGYGALARLAPRDAGAPPTP